MAGGRRRGSRRGSGRVRGAVKRVKREEGQRVSRGEALA